MDLFRLFLFQQEAHKSSHHRYIRYKFHEGYWHSPSLTQSHNMLHLTADLGKFLRLKSATVQQIPVEVEPIMGLCSYWLDPRNLALQIILKKMENYFILKWSLTAQILLYPELSGQQVVVFGRSPTIQETKEQNLLQSWVTIPRIKNALSRLKWRCWSWSQRNTLLCQACHWWIYFPGINFADYLRTI